MREKGKTIFTWVEEFSTKVADKIIETEKNYNQKLENMKQKKIYKKLYNEDGEKLKNTSFYKIIYKVLDKIFNSSEVDFTEEENKQVWDYFSFLICSQVFTFGTAFLLSFIFGYWKILIPLSITLAFLRSKNGGYHCDSFNKCYFSTNVSFIIMSIIGMCCITFLPDSYFMIALISLVPCVSLIPNCPLPWGNEESRGAERDKEFQVAYTNRVIILYGILILVHVLCSIYELVWLKNLSISISMGMYLSAFMGSFTGSSLMEKMWKYIDSKS